MWILPFNMAQTVSSFYIVVRQNNCVKSRMVHWNWKSVMDIRKCRFVCQSVSCFELWVMGYFWCNLIVHLMKNRDESLALHIIFWKASVGEIYLCTLQFSLNFVQMWWKGFDLFLAYILNRLKLDCLIVKKKKKINECNYIFGQNYHKIAVKSFSHPILFLFIKKE